MELVFDSVSKSFPGVQALDNVSFALHSGVVHGLVGENGAGKSTILKILSGLYTPSKGKIVIDGKDYAFSNTKDALENGISVIYQELNLAPEMTVEENLFIGQMPTRWAFINFKELTKSSLEALKILDPDINPKSKIKHLSIGQRQIVEITKALLRNAKIIAFDEPTSSLSETESTNLFKVINSLKNQDKIIIYVSHRMKEIFDICDVVTVFRDGRYIDTYKNDKDLTHDKLVSAMVGREISDIYGYRKRKQGDILFEAKDIFGKGLKKPVSFNVKSGEILGFFGLIGSGRTELLRLLYGAETWKSGKIQIDGNHVNKTNIGKSIKFGLALCPEDRKNEAIFPVRDIAENLNISARRHFLRFNFFINKKEEYKNANKFVEKLKIKTPSLTQLIKNLSGGNQQKVILARWLSEDIKVILLDEPTRGIDVGAKNEIYNLIYSLAEDGFSVIVVSSELQEVLGISDRIAIMREGEISAFLQRDEASEEIALKHALPLSAN